MLLDPADLWKRDIWRLPSGDLCVRPGFRKLVNAAANRENVGGFSIQNALTGEAWHYVFDVATSGPLDLKMRIFDGVFAEFQVFSFGLNVVPRAISPVVVQQQILVMSPDFPTLWGLVGSGVRYAVKQDSISGATAIDVPRGVATAWQNRPVACLSSLMQVGDPVTVQGGDLRSWISENANQRPGEVYGVHEAAGGLLCVATSAGVYGLDAAAAAVGVVGSNGTDWRVLNHHAAVAYDSSCVVRGRLYLLTKEGLILADVEDGNERVISDPPIPRRYGPAIGSDDFRRARLLALDEGPAVALEEQNALWRLDLRTGLTSWWTKEDLRVRGVLREDTGRQLLVLADGVYAVEGDYDGAGGLPDTPDADQPQGVLYGRVPIASDADTALVTSIRVRAASAGERGAAFRGGGREDSATPADGDGVVDGVTTWGDGRWTTTQMASVEFKMGEDDAEPGREPTIEAMAAGALVRVGSPAVDLSPSAQTRPRDQG